ncbi:MAG: DUF4142 domain-containing protein [Alphaproteobacteria bacterium]|nr:DUF4142 domain-containing protein [Alphaproteobacteria bacterium]
MIALIAAMPVMAQTKTPASPPPAATQAAPTTPAPATAQNAPAQAPHQAQPPTAPAATQGTGTALGLSDRHFIDTAAADGMAEVEMAKMAAAKASSPEVRDFANRMVADHSQANDKLMSLAQQLNATPPTGMTAKHQQTLNRANALSGAQFDREYMNHQVRDHVAAVALFRKESTESQNTALRQFAANTLPTLEDHLKQARTVQASLRAQQPTASSGSGDGRVRTSRRAPTGMTGGGEQYTADQLNEAEHQRYLQRGGAPSVAAQPCGPTPQQAMRAQVQPGAQTSSTKPPEANVAMQRMDSGC